MVRKVFGANTSGIVILISREFIKWVIVANIIAFPFAWYAIKNWLDGYVYHTKLSIDIFGYALLVSILIALVTVIWQSVSTALKNPVDAIKWE